MFLPVIFVFGEVIVKIGVLVMMVLALPLHLEGIWVFDVVIRVAAVAVTVVSTVFMLIVPLRLVVTVQIMCSVVISVPCLLLFVVILARCMRLFMMSELLLVFTILLVWLLVMLLVMVLVMLLVIRVI